MQTSSRRKNSDIGISVRTKISRALQNPWVLAIGTSAIICLFFWQYLFTGNKLISGDFDYYAQLYEAFRISVLTYHQLPLWNPWMSGGIPLFANPQFGLISIQSAFVLIFGTIYGLKLAYVAYALLGFWGMFYLCRQLFQSSRVRAILIGYIWIFCGFFAGHNISHYTFALYFLAPWLIYFLIDRRRKYGWLWLGILVAGMILSSVHYAFLMLSLVLVLGFIFSVTSLYKKASGMVLSATLDIDDALFIIKTALIVITLGGYRFAVTYIFAADNQRAPDGLAEAPHTVWLLMQALFLPIGTLIKTFPPTMWSWGEYSMYLGLGTGIVLVVCLIALIRNRFSGRQQQMVEGKHAVVVILLVGLVCAFLALGDFGKFSPFHLLRALPGFSETRVPSRWLIITALSILIFLASWRRQRKVIDMLLLASAVELFLSFGPPSVVGQNQVSLPPSNFSNIFLQYNNSRGHLGVSGEASFMGSYYYTTSSNIGQIYGDDPLVNTLSGAHPLPTSRCAFNSSDHCSFVLTNNAVVSYWSPNEILLRRTAPGSIELNMNVDSGWQVNGIYPFFQDKSIEPELRFILPGDSRQYTVRYMPRLSPSWLWWRLRKL